MTTLLNWFSPLDRATTLEEITEKWSRLLWDLDAVASFEDLRYHDAVLSFLARSTLPANLKFAAVFACVNPVDFDLRLALGLLAGKLDQYRVESSVDRPMLDARCIDIPCANTWLLGYVHGRLTEVQAAMGDSMEREDWEAKFWNELLVMSCRWASVPGVRQALDQGARPQDQNYRAVAAAAEGINACSGEAYYAEGRNNGDYRAVLDLLLRRGMTMAEAAAPALQAAAAAGNLEMLEYLIERGADVHAGDDGALIAAAGNHQLDGIAWLLEHGANVHAQREAALLAAISALSPGGAEMLLDAGADLQAVEEQALRAAFSSMPYELFAGEGHDFIFGRADMIALLLMRGADIGRLAGDPFVLQAPHGAEVIGHLLKSEEMPEETKLAIREVFRVQ